MERMITGILVLACSMLLFAGCEKDDVIAAPAYAIGTIEAYQKATGEIASDNFVIYHYFVNGVEYGTSYSDRQFGPKWEVPFAGYKKGDQYMVEYDAGCVNSGQCNDNEESRMLFNYRVRDSADYNRYIARFAVAPPTP